MKSISEIITERRKELGLSQLYISDVLGYTSQAISKWEKGKSIPGMPSWGALAKVLKIDLEAILDGKLKTEYNDSCLNNTFSFEKFAKNLRIQRKLQNMTQKDLAAKIPVLYQTLLAWEKGKASPSVEQFKKLAKVLGLTYDELYFGKRKAVTYEETTNNDDEIETSEKRKVKSWKKIFKKNTILMIIRALVVGGTITVGSYFLASDTLPYYAPISMGETLEKPHTGNVDSLRGCLESVYPTDDTTASYDFKGVDYVNVDGSSFNVISATAGIIETCSYMNLLGNTIVIKHRSGVKTIYASLGRVMVVEGQEVSQGQVIATSGESSHTFSLGSCLHFEVWKGDRYFDPEENYGKNLYRL